MIYKQYQAGFYGLSTAGNVVLFVVVTVIIVPLAWFLNRKQVETMNRARRYWVGGAAIVVSFFIFIVPFIYIVTMAIKDRRESARREFSWPSNGFHLWDNLVEVVTTRDFMLVTAFINSTILTVASVTLLVIFGAMVATWCSAAARSGRRSSTSWCSRG